MPWEAVNHEFAPEVAAGLGACDSETELVERAKTQPQAFGRLYELHYGRILNYVYRRTLDVAVAEEVTSNTFFNALRALPRYNSRGKFAAWLYRIASNEIKLKRRSQRDGREGNAQWREALCRISFPLRDVGAPEDVDNQEDAEGKMREFAQLHEALSCLPEKYQTVLALRYFEAMPYDEIADVLGKKIGTVKSLIHRGLERLKRQFESDGTTFSHSLHEPVKKE